MASLLILIASWGKNSITVPKHCAVMFHFNRGPSDWKVQGPGSLCQLTEIGVSFLTWS